MSDRPVWFLDVDGVVNAIGEPRPVKDSGRFTYRATTLWADDEHGKPTDLPIFYAPELVSFVNEVHRSGAADIWWLTTWEDQAAARFAPAIGLDVFKVVTRPPGLEINDRQPRALDWWKETVVRAAILAGVTRIIWTDDELDKPVRRRTEAALDEGDTLLIMPPETPGLTRIDMGRIRAFLSM